jgi:hypothetical protein
VKVEVERVAKIVRECPADLATPLRVLDEVAVRLLLGPCPCAKLLGGRIGRSDRRLRRSELLGELGRVGEALGLDRPVGCLAVTLRDGDDPGARLRGCGDLRRLFRLRLR